MIRRIVLCVVAVVLPLPAAGAPVPKALKKKGDENDIVGLWTSKPGQTTGWYFNPDGTAGCGDPNSPNTGCKAIYKLDPTQSPKHLDWSQDGGASWYLAIYEIEGDVLRINFGSGGSGRRPAVIGPNTGSQYETGTRNPDYKK